jgi:preprotein translocase subunit YajC
MLTSLYLASNLLSALQGEAPATTEPAPDTDGATSGSPSMLPLFVGLAVVFYFVMIMPEKKKRKQREAMLGALKKGDHVMTTSGIYGSVVVAADDVVTVQVAEGVRMRFSRAAIQNVLEGEEPKAE